MSVTKERYDLFHIIAERKDEGETRTEIGNDLVAYGWDADVVNDCLNDAFPGLKTESQLGHEFEARGGVK